MPRCNRQKLAKKSINKERERESIVKQKKILQHKHDNSKQNQSDDNRIKAQFGDSQLNHICIESHSSALTRSPKYKEW